MSVLMPAFNSERYIATAIESVLLSTFTDFEFIIVDDCSTDSTYSIIRDFAGRDSRIQVYRNERTIGDYPNRNKAASFARGKYLKYVDHDDYIYPWGLSVMVETMERFPESGWGICSLNQDPARPYPFELEPSAIFDYQNFKASIFHNPPLCAIIRRNAFENVGGFSGKPLMSDVELWHILAMKYNLVLMQHGLVWYRIHDFQESKKVSRDISVRTRYAVAKYHFYKNGTGIPMSKDKRKFVVDKMYRTFIKHIFINLAKGKLKSAFTIMTMIPNHTYDFKKVVFAENNNVPDNQFSKS